MIRIHALPMLVSGLIEIEKENQGQLANLGLPGKWPLNGVCMCVHVCACMSVCFLIVID